MDPLVDEKIILTVSRSFVDYFEEALQIKAWREAYGPSLNEGICFESLTKLPFEGELNGSFYFAMDGYTRMKLLPVIANTFKLETIEKGMADSILGEFANQIGFRILNEFDDAGYRFQVLPPESLNHKVELVELEKQRQYIVIFFIEDKENRKYLGRCHVIVV
ncbi:MAG: chemotaxis protein CheX, partial [Leptonema sp. (in: Bacteria)]|nr:chemotaxis protein CheX [Leptonema sp. (in: bacteria)]